MNTYQKLTEVTLQHYQKHPQNFWESTRDHDVSQNIQALLQALPAQKGLRILDLGCGPGRDLLTFKQLGHHPIGLDACAAFCQMAREYAACEVWEQNFIEIDLPENYFDGVFANASLFHVPKDLLVKVLKNLHQSLKSHGVLFSSNPRGQGEAVQGLRYGHYMELTDYQKFLDQAGFKIQSHYYRPIGLPCSEQPWLAVVALKQG